MLRTKIVSLNGTAQELTINDVIDNPNQISIQHISETGYAYLGNESVTNESYGHKLFPGQSFSVDLLSDDHAAHRRRDLVRAYHLGWHARYRLALVARSACRLHCLDGRRLLLPQP